MGAGDIRGTSASSQFGCESKIKNYSQSYLLKWRQCLYKAPRANIHFPLSVSATVVSSLHILVNAHKNLRKCGFYPHFTDMETGRLRFSNC